MAIKPVCLKCNDEFNKMGSLVFGPPKDPQDMFVPKLHLCRKCYFESLVFIGAPADFILAEKIRLGEQPTEKGAR